MHHYYYYCYNATATATAATAAAAAATATATATTTTTATATAGSMDSWLSVFGNFSFSYNTIFLSSVSRSSPVNSPFGEFTSFLN